MLCCSANAMIACTDERSIGQSDKECNCARACELKREFDPLTGTVRATPFF
jgi:hypothetical protein